MARKRREQSHDLSRRQMLKLSAGAAVGAPLAGFDQARKAPARKAAVDAAGPKFFTADEFALVDELAEMIIPTDDHSPGARAAKVAEYIDARLAESFEEGPRVQWRGGLKLVEELARAMHRKAFLAASPEEREAVLAQMAQKENNPQRPEERFFSELKRWVARGYYTSKIGIHEEMEYKGNTFLREFVGEDAQ